MSPWEAYVHDYGKKNEMFQQIPQCELQRCNINREVR